MEQTKKAKIQMYRVRRDERAKTSSTHISMTHDTSSK